MPRLAQGPPEGILAPLAVSRAVSHPRFAPLEPPEPRVSRRALARGGRTVVASALPMSASESDRRKAEIERLFEEFAPKFPGAPEITAEQLRRDITNGAKPVVLVDVRTEDEQDVSVIKSALRKPEFEARKEEFRNSPSSSPTAPSDIAAASTWRSSARKISTPETFAGASWRGRTRVESWRRGGGAKDAAARTRVWQIVGPRGGGSRVGVLRETGAELRRRARAGRAQALEVVRRERSMRRARGATWRFDSVRAEPSYEQYSDFNSVAAAAG